MNFIVHADSKSVILPLRIRPVTSTLRPQLHGVLISQAKNSGRVRQSFIELAREGVPRPFRGADWCYEWRVDGDGVLACWLGFPDVFFTASFEAGSRIAVEAVGFQGEAGGHHRVLAAIEITLKASPHAVQPEGLAGWQPDATPRSFPPLE